MFKYLKSLRDNFRLLKRARKMSQLEPVRRVATAPTTGPFRAPWREPGWTPEEERIIREFSELNYRRWRDNHYTMWISWLGYQITKTPGDLIMYQEIITRTRPDVVIECGTGYGGGTLFLATICDLVGHGKVITVDPHNHEQDWPRPKHPLITYVDGSSADPGVFARVRELAGRPASALVILDSDHSRDHVLAELRLYRELVPVGCYMVVEDSFVNGHPVMPEHGPGPWEAVDAFLAETDDFTPDRGCERFMLTVAPRGFLLRVKASDSAAQSAP